MGGVGASTSCYGLIGVQLGRLFVVEWPHIVSDEVKDRLKQHWVQVGAMLVFWELMNWKTIDHFGHLGGLLGGACMGVFLMKQCNMVDNYFALDSSGRGQVIKASQAK